MRTFLIGIAALFLYAVPARWHYVCQIRNGCEDRPIATATDSSSTDKGAKTLAVALEDSVLFADYEQFGFAPNSAVLQLTDNNKQLLAGIADYLKANPDARLKITGRYLPSEKSTVGIFDNLGLARAAAIRDYLVTTYKFPENRFSLDHEMLATDSRLDAPLEYEITLPKTDETPTARGGETLVEASYTFNRMTFSDINFAYNSAEFNPSPNFVAYADSVKTYLELNKNKKITIVGHTDNKGDDEINRVLGLRRANNVIIYLRDQKGIDIKRIDSDSKGELQPIAPNDTEANRRKNRRVEVIIK